MRLLCVGPQVFFHLLPSILSDVCARTLCFIFACGLILYISSLKKVVGFITWERVYVTYEKDFELWIWLWQRCISCRPGVWPCKVDSTLESSYYITSPSASGCCLNSSMPMPVSKGLELVAQQFEDTQGSSIMCHIDRKQMYTHARTQQYFTWWLDLFVKNRRLKIVKVRTSELPLCAQRSVSMTS